MMAEDPNPRDGWSPRQMNLRRLALPSESSLRSYRIWDAYFTPSHGHPGKDGSERLMADIERSMTAIERGCFEKLCYFAHVGIGTTGDPAVERLLWSDPKTVLKPLTRWPTRLEAMIQVNASDVPRSIDAINRWVQDGPMLGIYLPGSGSGALPCTHKNVEKLIRRVLDLKGIVMQHTWFKTGGKQGPGESTPAELVEVARRFPEQKLICAHAGGEWQRGLRAVRGANNILVETSGFDPTAGFIEMAVREVGARRIIFGSHLPSRSLGTELSKVVAAEIGEAEKRWILGENYRKLVAHAVSAKR